MTQEEKAKAYDKVREKIAIRFGSNVADEIFSKFEMSEDERIRKEIINYFKCQSRDEPSRKAIHNIWISWLEKQGEEKEYTFKSIPRLLDMIEPTDRAKAYCQKLIDTLAKEGYNIDTKIVEDVLKGWNGEDVPMAVMDEQKPVNDTDEDIVEAVKDISILDMVEPKFKVGDWIVYYRNDSSREILYVYDIRDGRYYLNDNIHLSWSVKECDEKCHLWTIQDAKDGDVLFHSDTASNGIFIFKELLEYEFGKKVICYCDYDSEDHFCLGEHHTCCWADAKILHPATKEQRDTLMKAMADAGYEWDAEKKEVKLLITNGGDFDTENCEQNPAWSEDDEEFLSEIISDIKFAQDKHPDSQMNQIIFEEEVTWLKSLKERIKHK